MGRSGSGVLLLEEAPARLALLNRSSGRRTGLASSLLTILDGPPIPDLALVALLPGIPEVRLLPLPSLGDGDFEVGVENLVHHVLLPELGSIHVLVALLLALVHELPSASSSSS